jgi:hypothetical protein
MPLTTEDEQVMETLAEAGALYERYLEVARVGDFTLADMQAEEEPPPPMAPLGLVIRSGA